jgi:hypothetical protein
VTYPLPAQRFTILSEIHRDFTLTLYLLSLTTGFSVHFKVGGQIINTVKYADDMVLLAKEEMVLQDMIHKLNEIGRSYGMEMNVGKNNYNENFKTTVSSKTYDRPKTTGECGIF